MIITPFDIGSEIGCVSSTENAKATGMIEIVKKPETAQFIRMSVKLLDGSVNKEQETDTNIPIKMNFNVFKNFFVLSRYAEKINEPIMPLRMKHTPIMLTDELVMWYGCRMASNKAAIPV